MSGTILSSVSCFFASCSFTSVALKYPLKYRQITSVWYRQQFLSIFCLPPSFAFSLFLISLLAGIYFLFYFKHALLYLFLVFVIRFSSLMHVDLFLNEFWVQYFISDFVTEFAKTYEFENDDRESSPHFNISFVIFSDRVFLD